MENIFDRIKALVRSPDRRYRQVLQKLGREVSTYAATGKDEPRLKILYGPSFCPYPPCYAHDAIFTAALRSRGAEIVPIYCDRVQHTECNFFGGVWGGGKFDKNCRECCSTSRILWKDAGLVPLALSAHLDHETVSRIDSQIVSLPDDNWVTFSADGLPFGSWAKDILVNNYVVGDYRLVKDHERLGRAHLRNLLVVHEAYRRILAEVNPDRVVCNDSYYGMWAILQHLCARKGIPFYSHWSGTRPGAWCYAFNDAAMNLDYRQAWPNFSSQALSEQQRRTVDEWLEGRLSGKDMLIDTASLAAHCNEEVDLSKIKEGKPTALLAANVIWDLAALNKQVVFADMIEWIAETIAWFGRHPEYQLIVKPHPAEQNPSIPETEERVATALARRGVIIPDNVAMLTPKSAITVYQLLPLVKVGITHTSTVGPEMAARGIPVITTARSPYRDFGFTVDPCDRDEYFSELDAVLKEDIQTGKNRQIDLVYKFILFQQFHYYSRIGIMDFKWGEAPHLNVNSLEDILPGKNKHFDYIVDSVLAGLPVVGENRWPSES